MGNLGCDMWPQKGLKTADPLGCDSGVDSSPNLTAIKALGVGSRV